MEAGLRGVCSPLRGSGGPSEEGPPAFWYSLASPAFLSPGPGEPLLQGWLGDPLGKPFAASAPSSCQ